MDKNFHDLMTQKFCILKTVSVFLVMQVRYSCTGGMYVTASKDGAIRIWDGVNSSVVRSIPGAHGSSEATSASFTKDQRYTLFTSAIHISVFVICD